MLYIGVLLLLILEYVRPQEFWGPMYGERVVFFSMMLLLPAWLSTLHSKKILRTPEELFMFLLWIMTIVSYLNWRALDILDPAREFGKTLLCFLFVAHVINTRRKLAGAVWMTMFALLLVTLLAGQDPIRKQYASVGSFSNRNEFATSVATLLSLAAVYMLRGRLLTKLIAAGIMVAGVSGVILSESRGGQLASIFGVFAVLYVQARSRGARTAMLIVGVLGLMVAMSLGGRLGTVTTYRLEKSAMGRVYAWQEALGMFKAHPFIGIGHEKFQRYSSRDSHSSYMRVIAELGGPGLFLYIGLLFYSLRDALSIARNAIHPGTRLIAQGMTGVLVGYMVGSLAITRAYSLFALMQIAVVSALRLVADRERLEFESSGEAPIMSGTSPPEPPGPWLASLGPGLIAPHLVTKKDFWKIIAITVGCWFTYKAFVIFSH